MAQDAAAPIREFIAGELGGLDLELADNTDIFETGLVTSLFAMELVLFLEQRFDIEIDIDDLDLENFASVDRMAALVERRTKAGPA